MAQVNQPGYDQKVTEMFAVNQTQQQQQQYKTVQRRGWSSELCGCFDDCGECLFAYFLPCCYLLKVYSAAGEGCCSCWFGGLLPLRVKVRTERGIEGSICGDVCTTLWCPFCSLVQVGKEVKNTNPLI